MDGLTQEGAAYSGFTNGGASNGEWRIHARNDERESPFSESPFPESFDNGQADPRAVWAAQLARTIEAEIIPRLMLAHRAVSPDLLVDEALAGQRGPKEVAEFCALVLNRDLRDAAAFVEDLLERGLSLSSIYLDLLAPTARRMGELWEADLCDFTEVTVGLGRLHQLLHELSPIFRAEGRNWGNGRRALLVPVPGEQHTLGLFMVAEFFRRDGWEVWGEPAASRSALADMVRAEWFDLVGLSAGTDCQLDLVASAILAVRRASRNRSIGVLVGGPVFIAHPEYVVQVGADAMATDAHEAVIKAQDVVALQERR